MIVFVNEYISFFRNVISSYFSTKLPLENFSENEENRNTMFSWNPRCGNLVMVSK